MSFYPLNWKLANRIRSTSAKRSLYHGHVAVQDVAPLNAAVASVYAAIPLTSAAAGQDIAAGWVAGAQAALALCPQPLEIKGVGAGVTGNVVITGTDICGNAITDTIAASGTSTVAGIKAFASVSNVHVPVQSTTGETISVGTTKAFGVPFLSAEVLTALFKTSDGSADTGTLSLHATDVAQSIYTPSATPDGTKKTVLSLLVANLA